MGYGAVDEEESQEEKNNLQISLADIKLATNDFSDVNRIGKGGFGQVYKGELLWARGHQIIVAKRLDITSDQGETELTTELVILSEYKHMNVINLSRTVQLALEYLPAMLYIECTSSAIQALTLFMKLHRGHRTMEIEDCISRAVKYIKDAQNPNGSWYGYWGICYTYGAWFAVDALVACRYNYHNSLAIQKSCEFLLSKQLPDGGWGESYLSSANKTYTNLDGNRSNLVQTSWALMSLIKAGQAEIDLVKVKYRTLSLGCVPYPLGEVSS
ncbi:lupeol synthase [Tanacetum coccineum]